MVPEGSEFNTFLDYIYDNPDGYDIGMGDPLAKMDGPGQPEGPVSDFSVCLGMLDQSGNQGGAAPGSPESPIELCTLQLNCNGAASTDVTVAADDLRGGAVGSTIAIIIDLDGAGADTIPVVCGAVEPECWGFAKFTCGDSDGNGTIELADFNVLAAAFNTVEGVDDAYDACADYSKDGEVSLADFNQLAEFFNATPDASACP
jgi:hypothetical protein